MSQTSYTIRSLNECTLDQAAALWNGGFSQYYTDMSKTVDELISYIGTRRIVPTLSVGMFVEEQPAGFVLVATRSVNGKLIAWNGGTGVDPAFRGMGLARPLMKAAVDKMRGAGVHTAYLEVVSKNVKAISAYQGAGFRIVDDLIGMKREGLLDVSAFPFADAASSSYLVRTGTPANVVALPFYLPHVPWSGQWFQLQTYGAESLRVVDRATGETVGYALFTRNYDDHGQLKSVVLSHCEAAPDRVDAEAIVHTALAHAFGPLDGPLVRATENLRSTNEVVMAALQGAGFETQYEQKLMVMEF